MANSRYGRGPVCCAAEISVKLFDDTLAPAGSWYALRAMWQAKEARGSQSIHLSRRLLVVKELDAEQPIQER